MVADRLGAIVGFYALDIKGAFAEVALLFVDSAEIRSGVGRRLWHHLLVIASSRLVKQLEVAAEPGAEGFYRRMGMIRQREIDYGGRRLIGMTLTLD
jgi:N-acetylglutamate synthase-like GNAT family acetyltransferase